MAILTIDQSTTSTSAFLVDNLGEGKILQMIKHQQIYPNPGEVEHDAEELISNIRYCIDSCEEVTAIGIDNQGESCLAWNAETKKPVSPVIVWQDNRTSHTIERLKSEGMEGVVLEKAGLPLDSYFSATKLAWIINHIPAAKTLLSQGKLRLGTTDAFFLDRLTGHYVTDISTASRTSLMNLQTGQWDDDLCRLFGVPKSVLPEIVSTTGDFGSVQSQGRNIPITASIVDQQAALYGHYCEKKGDTKVTFGTGAFALMVTGDSPHQVPEQGLLPTVAWQFENGKPIYALDGGVYTAGAAINWAKSLGLFKEYDQIQQFERNSAIEKGLVFVPALAGLGCPHWDRSAAGLWIGLALDTQPIDLMQSILEGIVFRAVEVIDTMNSIIPINNEISIDGGISENPYFCQFLADVLQQGIVVKSSADLTALGVARLAAINFPEQRFQEIPGRQYSPKTNRRPDLERFKQAAARAMKWKKET